MAARNTKRNERELILKEAKRETKTSPISRLNWIKEKKHRRYELKAKKKYVDYLKSLSFAVFERTNKFHFVDCVTTFRRRLKRLCVLFLCAVRWTKKMEIASRKHSKSTKMVFIEKKLFFCFFCEPSWWFHIQFLSIQKIVFSNPFVWLIRIDFRLPTPNSKTQTWEMQQEKYFSSFILWFHVLFSEIIIYFSFYFFTFACAVSERQRKIIEISICEIHFNSNINNWTFYCTKHHKHSRNATQTKAEKNDCKALNG